MGMLDKLVDGPQGCYRFFQRFLGMNAGEYQALQQEVADGIGAGDDAGEDAGDNAEEDAVRARTPPPSYMVSSYG